jgi:hypothetical protein
MRRGLALALLLVFGAIAGATLVEVGLRLRPSPREDLGHLETDPVLHHRLRKSWTGRVHGIPFETNALGLRDREYDAAKPPGTFRIFMLGDSFTEGGGLALDDTVARRVERGLTRARCGQRVEVVNGGTVSYSPILEYLQLKTIGLGLEPDLIVLNFDMTDVHDDVVRTAAARLDADGLPVMVPSDHRLETAIMLPPLPRPRGFGFLDPVERGVNRLLLYQELRRSRLGQAIFGPLRVTPERVQRLGLMGDARYDIEGITRDGEWPGGRAAWALTGHYITAIHRLAASRGARFVLVVYPHAQQVSATASLNGRRFVGLGPGLYASERPFEILEALGAREAFPVVNLLRLFRIREAQEGPLFREDDIHHTVAGARVFADGILTALLERRLVPCSS